MSQVVQIAIIISAIVLVGMASIAVNYSPAPAHAAQCWVQPGSAGSGQCYGSRGQCDQSLPPDSAVKCQKAR
jgi:hypothetical protein